MSAITLVEIALLWEAGRLAIETTLEQLFQELSSNPAIQLIPFTYDVALEVPSFAALRDPADRILAATARVRRLRLVTSDQRIVASRLVPVVE